MALAVKAKTATGACVVAGAMVASVAAPAFSQDPFPEEVSTAIELFEEQVPPDDWLDGPVEYIITQEERDIWGDLQGDEDRRQFIAWFWARRDDDPRDDTHKYKQEFYQRVADVNRRFPGFPRGWKSDRGRVWVTLGRPQSIRRQSLRNYGRCSYREGEAWTYYTNNRTSSFSSMSGEFPVYFVETRPGQFEICDPSMLGLGAYPTYLRRAFDYTKRYLVLDPVTEFAPGIGGGAGADLREATLSEVELDVPAGSWGDLGVGGVMVVPVEIPTRDLLFEPSGESLAATLRVLATLTPTGGGEPARGVQEWTLELGAEDAWRIGSGLLRTAIVMPAPPGGYAVSVRVEDPLSGTARRWQGEITVAEGGEAVSPPLLGTRAVRLREGGEVAMLDREVPRVSAGDPLAVVSWIRGLEPDPEAVRVTAVSATGDEVELAVTSSVWEPMVGAGPLVLEVSTEGLTAGEYTLRLFAAPGVGSVEASLLVR